MNKLDYKNDLLTKQITKLEEEALKPMSILEIKEKFNLSFPFKVKRVKNSREGKPDYFKVGDVTTVSFIKKLNGLEETSTNNVINGRIYQSAEIQDYILFEEN